MYELPAQFAVKPDMILRRAVPIMVAASPICVAYANDRGTHADAAFIARTFFECLNGEVAALIYINEDRLGILDNLEAIRVRTKWTLRAALESFIDH